jgi:RNA polymerase sigma-70 factor (ECF subfamily)
VREDEALAAQFEAQRARLRAVAYRMLGSASDADDAVQEAWLRLNRAGGDDIANLGGWLTTVVARVCLDMLRARTARREEALEPLELGVASDAPAGDPEQAAVLADSVGLALVVVLETLSPAERLAFVLHDMFAVPFVEIGPILGRSPDAAKQLASRARRRVRGAEAQDAAQHRHRAVVQAFLAAARDGDFAGLLTLLAPDAELRLDDAALGMGPVRGSVGATAVATTFANLGARAALPALIDGAPGAVWLHRGQPRVVFLFAIADDAIQRIEIVADPQRLTHFDVTVFARDGRRIEPRS